MDKLSEVLNKIKSEVSKLDNTAEIIHFGSTARGDFNRESDIDIIILVDKKPADFQEEINLKYPLYEIEIESGIIISPIIMTKSEWNTNKNKSIFLENVLEEGRKL
ncbi:nucleotidyltransferase domain-containing protein [Marivirga tractuosa]|uniref:nucleotidyltransferase domain-containing protein n=1 Tax=Marivirga tractuosa TaxID=1006 RepID=UPI0035D09AE1